MAINMKNAITITFRSKFSKKMLNDENKESVAEIFRNFCKLSPVVARPLLWKMSYDSETVIEEKFKDSGLDLTSLENVALFRNELRYQYEKLQPDFVVPCNLPENVQEAFSDLKDKMVDSVNPYMVWNRIQSYLEKCDNDSAERTLYLLGSDKEANFFGGLRSLRFNLKEADFLKPYHEQIANLLKVIVENKWQESSAESQPKNELLEALEQPENLFSSEAEMLEEEKKSQCEVPSTPPVTMDEKSTASEFKKLTAIAVLENKIAFEDVILGNNLNSLIELGALGFDLNEVMSHGDDIRLLLQAAKQLESAPVITISPFKG